MHSFFPRFDWHKHMGLCRHACALVVVRCMQSSSVPRVHASKALHPVVLHVHSMLAAQSACHAAHCTPCASTHDRTHTISRQHWLLCINDLVQPPLLPLPEQGQLQKQKHSTSCCSSRPAGLAPSKPEVAAVRALCAHRSGAPAGHTVHVHLLLVCQRPCVAQAC